MNIEDYEKLTRDEMYTRLKELDPALAKGKSRAKKDELVELYRGHLVSKAMSVDYGSLETTTLAHMPPETVSEFLPPEPCVVREYETHKEIVREYETHKEIWTKQEREGDSLTLTGNLTLTGKVEFKEPIEFQILGVDLGDEDMTAIALVNEQSDGTREIQTIEHFEVDETPREVVSSPVGRKDLLFDVLRRLSSKQLELLNRYNSIPRINRKALRVRQALRRKIQKFLPRSVTIDEVLSVI